MLKKIEEFFKCKDLDIRKSHNARFFDQKVQPDVLSAVCESILYCIDDITNSFSVNDIRYCDYSNELVTEIFNKPEIKKASNEYDKFFSQPLKMLAYAGLIKESKKGRENIYLVIEKEMIEYISLRDRNAYYFLTIYLEKVLKDSGIWELFENFFMEQTQSSLEILRHNYINFIIHNTPINKELEPIRILNPLLNILSFKYKKLGTVKGKIKEINYNDLLYNRPNWRDIKKDKSLTRSEFNVLFFEQGIDNKKSYEYYIAKAKRFVKNIHKISEIHKFNSYPATQAHHIFLASNYPELADIPENIIAITPNQHFYRAHPNNKTSVIDKSYQIICLIAKLDSIEIDYYNNTEYYNKNNFIDVINIGLEQSFDYTISFEELKHNIMKLYI
jgi:hypothetical protein